MKAVLMNKTIQLIRFLSLIAVLLALPTGHVSAALRSCRTDPIFRLSNGEVIAVTLEIGARAYNIRNMHYILHLPPGVTVTKVIYTAGPRQAMKETYDVYQDNQSNSYTTDTVVTTIHPGRIKVVATTRLNGVFAKAASGYNDDHLIVTLVKP